MLFLTRKEGQVLNFYTTDGVIQVHVKSFRNGHVRIGVDAPMTVQIMRDEIDDGLASPSPSKDTNSSSQLQKMHQPLVSRIIHRCINFLSRQVDTGTAKCTQ